MAVSSMESVPWVPTTPSTSSRCSSLFTASMMVSVSSKVIAEESNLAMSLTSSVSLSLSKVLERGSTSLEPVTVGTTAPVLSCVLAMVPPVERTTTWPSAVACGPSLSAVEASVVSAGAALVALCGAEDSGAAAEVSSSGWLSGFWQEAKRQAEATRARPARAERRIVEVCIFPRFCVWEAKAGGGNRRPRIRPSKAEARGVRCHYGLANTETRGEQLVDVLIRRRHH